MAPFPDCRNVPRMKIGDCLPEPLLIHLSVILVKKKATIMAADKSMNGNGRQVDDVIRHDIGGDNDRAINFLQKVTKWTLRRRQRRLSNVLSVSTSTFCDWIANGKVVKGSKR